VLYELITLKKAFDGGFGAINKIVFEEPAEIKRSIILKPILKL
jgi:hypothetical protein